ncbi:sigma 54 modulation/S30EA ribosomal C-terminal domain-containing protein [Rhizosaccharibacter radicis]|uniref:Ribosome hibernation promoting factor n=1 Tax=Rhizosaccharibacter radicis TaxID=2782605 RepID=A0ABT1VXA4_9PROT|nr:HPF/RaiA family ribosome-associated protein [Acetobacteraceae bacterium KSS12]
MRITVGGACQEELNDTLRRRVASHLSRIAARYFGQAEEACVTFGRARSFFTCDINLQADRGLMLHGEGEAADAPSAFDDAVEHIARRLRRYRRRVREHARDVARRDEPEIGRQYVLKPTETDGSRMGAGMAPVCATVVDTERMPLSTLSVGEALMRLELADEPALMFRNCATGEINAVVRRPDGLIGWMDPTSE